MSLRLPVLGFPVELRPAFFVVAGLLGYEGRLDAALAVWIAVVTVSVLWHELGHALAARRYGAEPEITLYAMGGVTRWSVDGAPTPTQRLVVSLAGPLVEIALGLVFLVPLALGWVAEGLGRQALWWLAWVNIVWGAVNLLPMLPLDGGHVTESLVEMVWPGRGADAARALTLAVALGVGVLAVVQGWWWLGVLGAWMVVRAGVSWWQAGRVRAVG